MPRFFHARESATPTASAIFLASLEAASPSPEGPGAAPLLGLSAAGAPSGLSLGGLAAKARLVCAMTTGFCSEQKTW